MPSKKVPLSEIVAKNQTPRAKRAVEKAVRESIKDQNELCSEILEKLGLK